MAEAAIIATPYDLKDEDKCVFQDLSFGPCGKYE